MKLNSAFVIAAGLCVAAQVNAGDITGTVTLNGTPPPEKPITPLKDDPTCGKLHSEMPTTHFYVVGPNKELADTVVMLKGAGDKAAGASAAPVVLDQKGCLYEPQILAIQAGEKLLVRNSDPATVPMHNVHINPTTPANQEANASKMNVAQISGAPDVTYTFPAGENFMKFQCDVHPWMFAWVTVVDGPFYAVTGKDGKFTIKNVPPGKYHLVALHRKAAPTGVDKEIEVTADGAKQDFTLEVK
jgi:plastocyanin